MRLSEKNKWLKIEKKQLKKEYIVSFKTLLLVIKSKVKRYFHD